MLAWLWKWAMLWIFFFTVSVSGVGAQEKIGDELVIYSAPAVSAFFEALADPFANYIKQKYGAPVKVTVVTASAPVIWAVFEAEWPHPSGDVYMFYNENIREAAAKGYLEPLQPHYSDAEWARFDPEAMRRLDADGYAAPFIMTPVVLVAQKSLPEDAVTGWSDFSKTELKGRYTFESAMSVGAGYAVVAAAALTIGADWRRWFRNGQFDEAAARPTFKLVRRWAENSLTLTSGSGTIRPLLARREALVSGWWWANAVQEIRNGLDLRIVYPKEGTLTQVQAGPVISSASKNPVAAIEWVKFVHSDVASKVAIAIHYPGRIPLIGEEPAEEWKDYRARVGKTVPIDDFRAAVFDPAYNEAFMDAYRRIVIQGKQ